ncbi:MAG: DNA polymerase IV [Christensenellaceae bacterium]|jgi:DNA polymerase-4|nr:DNA polymerase IV [Christensenellaceae bacterium]
MSNRIILHSDINNFFASVEMLLDPSLQGKAIAVCGDPALRHGIILAKNYPAKKAGVTTGETIWQAQRKCPELILVSPHYHEYVTYSRKIYEIYVSHTPNVESFGLDECWLDMTGCAGSTVDDGSLVARAIADEVKEKTGLTVSVGASFTKTFAKLGSDIKKPDAVTVISKDNFKSIAWPLPATDMLYIGKASADALHRIGLKTIGDVACAGLTVLEGLFGKRGSSLYMAANGLDNDPVSLYTYERTPKSIGNGTTTPRDIESFADAQIVIYSLCEMVAFRLREHSALAGAVSVQTRDSLLLTHTKQGGIFSPTSNATDIADRAVEILKSFYNFKTMPHLRTITVAAFKLTRANQELQTSFFQHKTDKNMRLDKTIDCLRNKYGYNILKRGITMDGIFTADSLEAVDEFIPFHGAKKPKS